MGKPVLTTDLSFFDTRDGAIRISWAGDNESAKYMLSGERFDQTRELLQLLSQYDSACLLDKHAYATKGGCDFNCLACQHSIYALLKKKEEHFNLKCQHLCLRVPKPGDCWEVSLVLKANGYAKTIYQSFFFECVRIVPDITIVDYIYELFRTYPVRIDGSIRYCYIKVRRFDMTNTIDVSQTANEILIHRRNEAYARRKVIEEGSAEEKESKEN